MRNNITELVFILDQSGSMAGLKRDTIGGFNSMIEKQRRQEGACYVTTILFNNISSTLHDRLPLADIPKMTEDDYTPMGCTALIDAISGAIEHISGIHKYARPEDVPEHTLFVITTDGMENASKKYTSDDVKSMIEQRKECGWEFLFVGANIDAVETAASFGIGKNRAVDYCADSEGTEVYYDCITEAISAVRCCEPLSDDWSEKIEADFKRRKSR